MDELLSSNDTCSAEMDDSKLVESSIKKDFFSCKFCAEKFYNEMDLKMHYQLHSGSAEFCCLLCRQKFSSLNELKMHDLQHSITEANEDINHLRDLNIFEETFVCHICDKTFGQEDELMKHSMLHLVPETQASDSKAYVGKENRHILYEINKCYAKEEDNESVCNIERPKKVKSKADGKDFRYHSIGKEELSSNLHFLTTDVETYNKTSRNFKLSESSEDAGSELEQDLKYFCKICNIGFAKSFDLKRHSSMHSIKFYSCNICEESFSNEKELKKHSSEHLKTQSVHSCHLCEKKFSTKAFLDQHLWHKHDIKRSYKCSVCKETFKLENELINHEVTHENIKKFVCSKCNKRFRTAPDLKIHSLTHTLPRMFKCSVCGYAFKKFYHLKRHCGSVHKLEITKPSPVIHNFKVGSQNHVSKKENSASVTLELKEVSCYVCKKIFYGFESFKQHFQSVHRELKMYECHLCFRHFAKLSIVRNHLLSHTSTNKFKCSVCHRKFSTVQALLEHRRSHLSSNPYKCAICNIKFKSLNSFKRHVLNHEKAKRSNYKCLTCALKFATKNLLSRHLLQFHNPNRKHICEVCDKRFGRQQHLIRHMKIHQSRKELPDYSGSFKLDVDSEIKSAGVKHGKISSHRNVKTSSVNDEKVEKSYSGKQESSDNMQDPDIIIEDVIESKAAKPAYTCDVCNRSFSKKDLLIKHKISIHSAKKSNHECPVCGKYFQEKFNLETHLLVHEEQRQVYQCKYCVCSFSRHSLLRQHMERKHKMP